MLQGLFRALAIRVRRAAPSPGAVALVANQDLESRLGQGVAFQKAGQLQKAEAIYKSVLFEAPASANALNLLATVEHARGALDGAEELARQALAIHPQEVEYLNTLGIILGDSGRAFSRLEG